MILNNKKSILNKTFTFILLILIVFILAVFYFTYIKDRLNQKNEFPLIPDQTGAILEPRPEVNTKPLEKFYELMEKTPIKESQFEIKANYKSNKLEISLKEPANISKAQFETWLEKNGYSIIPKNKFEFLITTP